MLKEDFEKLLQHDALLKVEDLSDKSDRTLLYGYTCDRSTFHVYLKEGTIHVIVYKPMKDVREINVTVNQQYIPDKRLYPEACDFEFCKKLQDAGCFLPFTPWDDDRGKMQYYGYVMP